MSAKPLKSTPPIFRVVVSLAAEPVVFWLPTAFTPGRTIAAEPSKSTPPIARAVVNVAADPDHAPPVSVAVPSEKLVPETAPEKVPVVPETAPEKVPVVPETAPVKVPAPPETVPVAVTLVTETEFTVKAPLTVRSF